jgi:hypothetical protein
MASRWAAIYRVWFKIVFAYVTVTLALAAVFMVYWTLAGLVDLTVGPHRWYSWSTIWLGPVFIVVLYGMYRVVQFSKKFFDPD